MNTSVSLGLGIFRVLSEFTVNPLSLPISDNMGVPKSGSSQVSWALLTEGVTRARVDVHRLHLMVNRVLKLVSQSQEKERIWQVAGDLLMAFPERVGEIEDVLDRTSYALTVMGEDFLRGRLSLDDRFLVDLGVTSHPREDKSSQAARVAARYLTHGAEGYFVDQPSKKEVRQFAESNAISNIPGASNVAIKNMDNSTLTPREAERDSKKAPPTPTEIVREPGGKDFSTLNRYLIETEQKTSAKVPQSRDDVPKHPRIIS